MEDFKELVREAHKRDIKIIVDFVPNHCSNQHKWFKESEKNKTNSKKDWFYWRDKKDSDSIPNNWRSVFSGYAWTWSEKR